MAKKNSNPENGKPNSKAGNRLGNVNSKKVEKLAKELKKQFEGKKVNVNKFFKKLQDLGANTDEEIIIASRTGMAVIEADGQFLHYYADLAINDMNELTPPNGYDKKQKQAYKKALSDCRQIVHNRINLNE